MFPFGYLGMSMAMVKTHTTYDKGLSEKIEIFLSTKDTLPKRGQNTWSLSFIGGSMLAMAVLPFLHCRVTAFY